MNQLPYLLPWVRVALLIRSIRTTTFDETTWSTTKTVLARALSMRSRLELSISLSSVNVGTWSPVARSTKATSAASPLKISTQTTSAGNARAENSLMTAVLPAMQV